MARTKTISIGWRRPATDEEFRVTLHVTPGTPRPTTFGPRSTWVPGDEDADIEVVEVCEDAPGGAARDDLIDEVEKDLDALEGDALEAAAEYDGPDTMEEAAV